MIMDEMTESRLEYAFARNFPRGPVSVGGSAVADARMMIRTIVNVTERVLRENGSPLRLVVDIDADSPGHRIVALIVFTGETTVEIPLTVSASCLRIRDVPYHLLNPGAAVSVFRAILAEIDAVVVQHMDEKIDAYLAAHNIVVRPDVGAA